MEEQRGPLFPPPVRTDRPAAWEIWRDGGNVYPSGSGPLGTMAFVSPEDGKAGVGIYASLWSLNGLVPELFYLPGIPPNRTVYLYDDNGRVPSTTRERVAEILKEKGLEVVARLSGTRGGQDWIVPMIPIDAGAGQVRLQGWVPADPKFVGDYTVTVEVRWGESWHRLREPGRFRIHPLHSNGSKLRIPERAHKHKLWVSPTGQPVVIGWDPDWNFRSAPSENVVFADQPYWIRFWDGRYYLLGRDQMVTFGFSKNPTQPDIRKEDPIVEAEIDVNHSGGIVTISDGRVFEDRGGDLGARLEKAFEILRIRWPLEGFQPLPQPQEDEQHVSLDAAFKRFQQIGDIRAFHDFLALWGTGGWERMSGVLHRASFGDRERFLRLMHQSFDRWARRNPHAPVFRAFSDPLPRSIYPSGPPLVAFSLNGVRDVIWRQREELKGRPIEQTLLPGGGPLAVARAAANFREGGEVDIVALGFGESGNRLFAGLRQAGFLEELVGGRQAELISVEGQESRISVNGVVSSSPTVPTDVVQEAMEAAIRRMAGYGQRKGTLVIGEHLVRVSDLDDPYWVAKQLADLVKAAKEMGWEIAVAASSSWDAKTFNEILSVQPNTFHIDLEPFARLVSTPDRKFTEQELLYLPKEELAQIADRIRGLYGLDRLIVSLGAAGEILVTSSAWVAAIPSPDLEMTYVTGERDMVLGVFARLLQMGVPEKKALHQAVVAGVLHMEGWGRPVTEKRVVANLHRVSANELLRPAENRPATAPPTESPSFPEAHWPQAESKPGPVFHRISVGGPADLFAREARPESSVRVVVAPSALGQVNGLARVVEFLAGTSLGQRLVVLPSSDMPFEEFNYRMNELVRDLQKVKDLSVVGYADEEDPSMKSFIARIRLKIWPFDLRKPQELAPFVRQLLLDLGVPEGVATQEAVQNFLSAAGLEQAA